METALFDSWTDQYDAWFTTPVGLLVKEYESGLLLELLAPKKEEHILDAGCGTGIFTREILARGARVAGVDLSVPMLARALAGSGAAFAGVCADIRALPFPDHCFDRAFSMTAIEFVDDARAVVEELERVVRPGGRVVVTTLNSLSPWARRRRKMAEKGHSLFRHARFRSPADMRRLVPEGAVLRTAVHFSKEDPVEAIAAIEEQGSRDTPDTGALLAVQWRKRI